LESTNESDLEAVNARLLLIDGSKVRSQSHRVGNEKIAQVVVFNDGILSGFDDKPTSPDKSPPYGSIANSNSFSEPNFASLLPLFWCLRMDEASFKTVLSNDAVLESRRGSIDAVECLIITESEGRRTSEYWISPALDFNVLRRVYRAGRTTLQNDIAYERHAEFGWVPASWKSMHFVGNRLISERRSVVDQFLINVKIPESEFQLSFPPGMLVHNRIEGNSYITRAGGEKRPILPKERGATFNELKATEPGQALIDQTTPRRLRAYTLGALMVILAALLALRMWSRAKG
jgi:hypothetical protein